MTDPINIRNAVRDCINTDLNDILANNGLNKYEIGGVVDQSKFATNAIGVYKPNYDSCNQNDLRVFVSQRGREFLFEESLQNSRDRTKFSQISSNYSIYVELYKRLCGQPEDGIDAYPTDVTDELQSVFDLMENLLFCKRQYNIEGSLFFQDQPPVESGPEEGYFEEAGVFAKQFQLTFRVDRCCT